ncbi:MAG TPA: Gfo/Idh/MocA family oxidoreductase [Povalibacter sp.]
MTQPLNVAVIGTGFIGRVHVRSARLAGANVIGVAASTPARSIEAAASMNVPKGYANGLDAVRDRDVDVIHICTPNTLHVEVARAALEAGKHVVCEKPLATSLKDALALADLAKAKGLVATVPFVNRIEAVLRSSAGNAWTDIDEVNSGQRTADSS